MAKHIVKFGSTTNVSGETINEPTEDSTTGAPSWSISKSQYSRMNVVVDINSITGTSPTLTVTVKERFSGAGFVETAKSRAFSTAGTYVLAQHASPAGQTSVLNDGAFPALGSGTDKQIVTTAGGTVGAVNADFYLVFFD